ncbi:uncharacterized protein LOC34620824 [Cyclospora cayetanensis]|uniref:protein-histidine N-methyltransferase n=1 Tax=Cyclospora cayetanensis TaxID=88456 RepID=A0A6P6RWU9_9EIME|nr:uncharacterized protein LOC34620824 [Cyclospora cayetanensis]
MAFPASWGTPPRAFASIQVTSQGEALPVRPKPGVKPPKRLLDSQAANLHDACFGEDPSAAEVEVTGKEATKHDTSPCPVFHIVEGCPSASNDLLVQAGNYEGGFAVWECTWDLLGFLQPAAKGHSLSCLSRQIDLQIRGGHVLDLGCGQGLLGIWALQRGASAVAFQDLNTQTIGDPVLLSRFAASQLVEALCIYPLLMPLLQLDGNRERLGLSAPSVLVLEEATRWNILKNITSKELPHSAPLHVPPATTAKTASVASHHSLHLLVHQKNPSSHAGGCRDAEKEAGMKGGVAAVPPREDHSSSADAKSNGALHSFQLLDGRALCLAANWTSFPQIYCSCQQAETNAGTRQEGHTGKEERPCEETRTYRGEGARGISFDVVLCSEGVYREEAFEPLAHTLLRALDPNGIALVASKRYYFGVGGGSLPFLSFLKQKFPGSLSAEVIASFRGQTSNNFRDILLIKKANSKKNAN